MRLTSCLIVVCLSLGACSGRIESLPSLLSVEDFNQLDSSQITLIDFRPSKRFLQGHIPGAQNIYRRDVSDTNHTVQGMRCSKFVLQNLLRSKGLTMDRWLVIYDDNGSVGAARLWWICQLYGLKRVSILDGGLMMWKEAGGQTTKEVNSLAMGDFSWNGPEEMTLLATYDDVLKYQRSNHSIVDARSADEYNGAIKGDAAWGGHVKGAQNVDYYQQIDKETNKLRSVEELKQLYQSAGVDLTKPVVVYCHSGVRSAMSTFVLREVMGVEDVRNYDGSWMEWTRKESKPELP